MIPVDATGHAEPGNWYRHYLHAWNIAFPQSPLRPGRFYEGKKWASSTPAWDAWWFENRGCKPPYYRLFIEPKTAAQRGPAS